MNSLHNTDGANSEPMSGGETRVLHPVRQRDEWPRTAPAGARFRRICVVDTETTGLAADRHKVIEICAAIVLVDEFGRVAAVQSIGSGLEDPGHPLSREITELTGLRDADLAGIQIDRDKLTKFISYCEGVVAFNSVFDRPFVEALLPALPLMPWGCAMKDVPWRQLEFEPGPQNYLLMQSGRFNAAAHRAQDDVLSLIQILDHVCHDGESVMSKVLLAIDAPAWRFEASNAAYGYREDLREQRYRWAPARTHRLWHKHVRAAEHQDEINWYVRTIGKQPVIVPLPASQRYRADSTWKPA